MLGALDNRERMYGKGQRPEQISSFGGCREERAGVPASTVLERGELRTNTAPGGRMLDSLAGASKGLKGKGKKPPP